MGGGVGVFDKEYQSAPVNCKADRLCAFCASRAKMSAIRTRHDKTTLLVTKGTMGIFGLYERSHIKRYWINQMLYWLHVCIRLRLLVWNGGRSHVKKNNICKKVGGGGAAPHFLNWGGKRPPAPPRPPPMKKAKYISKTDVWSCIIKGYQYFQFKNEIFITIACLLCYNFERGELLVKIFKFLPFSEIVVEKTLQKRLLGYWLQNSSFLRQKSENRSSERVLFSLFTTALKLTKKRPVYGFLTM